MKTPILILAVLGCPYAVANGYYHQEYNYKTSSSDYKNNELQHKTGDQGFNSYGSSRRHGVRSNLRSITSHLQKECEKDLLDAIRQNAVYKYSSRIDIAELERQIRHNLTERLNNEISRAYGEQVIRDRLSYSLTEGRLQTNANFDNQKYLDLKNQLKNLLLNNLRNQYSRYKPSSSSSSYSSQYYNSGDNYVYTTTSTRRPPYYPANYYETSTYRPIYPSLPTDHGQSISGRFWNLINNLPHGYFAKPFAQVNYLDKRMWEEMFRLRIEELREQLKSGLSEKVFKTDIIRLQGLIGKYSLSPVIYEDVLEALENFVSNLDNSHNYLRILTEVRNEFRGELKAYYSLLNECIKGDANLGREEIDYYKSLLDDRSLKNTSSKKVFLSPILDKDVVSKRKESNPKLRNISKLLPGTPTQAITSFLAAQLAFTRVEPNNSSELVIRKQSLPLNNRLLSGIKVSILLQSNDSSIKNIVSENPILLLSSNSTLNKKEEDTIVSIKEANYSILTDAFTNKIQKVKNEINKLIIALTKDNNIQRSKRSINSDSSATTNSFGIFTRTNFSSKATTLENEIRKMKEDIAQLKKSTAINSGDRERLIGLEATAEILKKLLDDQSRESAQKNANLESLIKSLTDSINGFKKEIVGMKRKAEEQEREQKQNGLPAECVEAIKSHDFKTAEEKIKSINDDTKINFIIKEVYNHHIGNFDLVLKFGNSIADINRSVLIYSALSYEIESNGHKDVFKMIELTNSISATLFRISPEVKQKAYTIVNDLKNSIKNIAKEKLKGSMLNDQYISNTEITELSNKVFLLRHELFDDSIKEVVNNVYKRIDTNKILDCINSHSYLDQIIAGLIAVFDEMQSRADLNNSAVIKLAHSILNVKKQDNFYNKASFFKKNALESLQDRLPISVKNMVFSSKVCIKNIAYNEYLYAAFDAFKHDDDRRRVFTYVPGGIVTQGVWRLEKIGLADCGDFFIKNTQHNEYLYAASIRFGWIERRWVFTWIPGERDSLSRWRIEPAGDNVYIKSIEYSQYLFADSYRKYSHDRRYVFTFQPGSKTEDSLWSIEDCSREVDTLVE